MVVCLTACTAKQPSDIDNVCAIFDEHRKWYNESQRAADRWGTSIPIIMAFIHQESSFKAKAKPPRTKILWVLPGQDQPPPRVTPKPLMAPGTSTNDQRVDLQRIETILAMRLILLAGISIRARQKARFRKLMLITSTLLTMRDRAVFKRKLSVEALARDSRKKVAARSEQYAGQLKSCERRFKRRFLFF